MTSSDSRRKRRHVAKAERKGERIRLAAPPVPAPAPEPPVVKPDHTFERHPFFTRRLKVGERDAFFTHGPEQPLQQTTRDPIVSRTVSLYVSLPEQPRNRSWWGHSRGHEYVHGAPTKRVEKWLADSEARLIAHAEAVLGRLGLLSPSAPPAEQAPSPEPEGGA